MKKFKMISCWILISLIVQSGIFLFLNSYFKTNTNVTVKKIDIKLDETKKDLHIDIPRYIKDEKISYDGNYIAFKENNKLKILDTLTGDSKDLDLNDDFIVSNINWLYDRERILISGKKNGEAIIYTIDMDNIENKKELNVSSKIQELSEKHKKKTKTQSNFKIDNFTISPVTAVFYLKVSNRDKDSYIYRVNASDSFEKLNLDAGRIKDMSIIPVKDKLVYENYKNNNFYITRTEPNPKIKFKNQGNFKLLRISKKSKLYVGDVSDDKIKSIICKDLDSNSQEENIINLKEEVPVKDIFVTINGNILINSTLNNKVLDLTNNKEYKYEGTFLSFFENGFASLSEDNKLNKYSLK